MTRRALALGLVAGALVGSSVRAQPADAPTPDAAVPMASPAATHPTAAPDAAVPTPAPDAAVPTPAPIAADAGTPPASGVPLLPAARRPTVRATLSPANGVRTGALVTLTIDVETGRGDDVSLPSQSFAPLEFHAKRREVTTRGNRTQHHFELDLLALEPGEVELAPVELRVLLADGEVGAVLTERLRLRVASHIANEPNATPKAPPPPLSLWEEDPRPRYAAYALAAMLVGGALALLARRWWTRRPKVVPPPPPPPPPWEPALARLEQLRVDGPRMIQEGQLEVWVEALSDVVRTYLGERYSFEARECTTNELLTRVREKRIRELSPETLGVFLGECDLVKFARGSMSFEEAEKAYVLAHDLVKRTIPAASLPGYTYTPGATPGGAA